MGRRHRVYVATRRPGHRARLAAHVRWACSPPARCRCCSRRCRCCRSLDHIATSVRWAGAGPGRPLQLQPVALPRRRMDLAECLRDLHGGQSLLDARPAPDRGARTPRRCRSTSVRCRWSWPSRAAGFRGGPPWRAWMTAVAMLSLWASARRIRRAAGGPRGRPAPTTGDDSFYSLLATALPALRLFRFPFKLLDLHVPGPLGAGRVRMGPARRPGPDARRTFAMAAGLLGADGSSVWRSHRGVQDRVVAAIAARGAIHAVFGPLDASAAAAEIVRSLATERSPCPRAWPSCLVRGAMAVRRGLAGAGARSTADLAIANAPLVIAIPQADFEREPEVIRAIRDAERQHPDPGPFRIQRLPSWVPIGWAESASTDRLRELVDWEIDTLQPSFGWLHGSHYVFVDESQTGRAASAASLPSRSTAARRPGLRPSPGYRAGPTGPLPSPGSLRPVGCALTSSSRPSRTPGPARIAATPPSWPTGHDLPGPASLRSRARPGSRAVAADPGCPGPAQPAGVPPRLGRPRRPAHSPRR